MKHFDKHEGVPAFDCEEFSPKTKEYCLLIPIINEGNRIKKELEKAHTSNVSDYVDIIICDGGSNDGSTAHDILKSLSVNTLLVKRDTGKQQAFVLRSENYAFSAAVSMAMNRSASS